MGAHRSQRGPALREEDLEVAVQGEVDGPGLADGELEGGGHDVAAPRDHHLTPAVSCTRSMAAIPKRVDSTRSNAVGVPPRWTCPSITTRVSKPVRSPISRRSGC